MSVPEWLTKEPVPPQKMDRFRERVETIGESVTRFEVTEESLPIAVTELHGIRDLTETVNEFIEPFRLAARENLDAVLARRRELVEPLVAAETLLKQKVVDFRQSEHKQIETLQKQAAELAKQKRHGDVALAMVKGDAEHAEALQSLPVVADALDLKPMEAEGIQFRERWQAYLPGDEEAATRKLCAAIGEGKAGAALNLVKVNWPAAHALARSMKSDLANLGIGLAAKHIVGVALEKKK